MGSTDQARTDLVVDIGNSRLKMALFRAGELLRSVRLDELTASGLDGFLSGERPGAIGVASVGSPAHWPLHVLSDLAPVHELTGASPSPVPNAYADPRTLGVDRLANAAALHVRFPGRAALAIDLGTCITYDLVLPDRGFVGGAISPGPRMRGMAMHRYSARLPLVENSGKPPLAGGDTLGCIASGIHHGVRFEVAGMIADLRATHPGLAVVLTGGAAPAYVTTLKSGIFADPLLTLVGIHVLLAHQLHPSRGR